MKLTSALLIAACMLLQTWISPPVDAFPFFHRKPQAEQQPETQQPREPASEPTTQSTTPAFRPYNPPALIQQGQKLNTTKTNFSPYIPSRNEKPVGLQTNRIIQTNQTYQANQSQQFNQTSPVNLVAPNALNMQNMSGTTVESQPAEAASNQLPVIHPPPEVPSRPPIPPPPVVQAPVMVLSGDPTPSLAWRAVAYKLWLSPESQPPKRSKSQSSFACATAVTMKALVQALNEAGWTTSQIVPSAGQLLAAKPENENYRIKLIFAAHPTDGGTVVRATTDPDSNKFDKTVIEAILTRAQAIAARSDLL